MEKALARVNVVLGCKSIASSTFQADEVGADKGSTGLWTLDWTVFIFDPPAALHFFHGRGVSRVSRPIEEGLSFYSTRPMSSGGSLDISTRTSTLQLQHVEPTRTAHFFH